MSDSADRPAVLEVRTVTHAGGGPEKTILLGARFLRDRGWPVEVVYLHPPGDPGFTHIRQKAAELEIPLVELEDRGPLDVAVIKHLYAVSRQKGRIIWHGHDYKADAVGWLLHRFHSMTLVSTVHGWGVYGPRVRLYHFVHKLCLRGFDKVLCVSQALKEECLRAGLPGAICEVLENGVDCRHFCPQIPRQEAKMALGLPADAAIVGYVGRLSPEKDLPTFLRALAELRHLGHRAHGLLVGDGPDSRELVRLAAELGVGEHVTFTGHSPDPRPHYSAIDVFVLPSRREGLPNVLLEAMAMTLPVVATPVGGIPQVLEEGKTGLFFPCGDAKALARVVARLLENPGLRATLGQNARRYVSANRSFEKRMERLEQIYLELCR